VSSQCQGASTGTLVFIGHDFVNYSLAQATLLSNAVLLPQKSKTLPVLSYERYANALAATTSPPSCIRPPRTSGARSC
jgi:hypothetical protein